MTDEQAHSGKPKPAKRPWWLVQHSLSASIVVAAGWAAIGVFNLAMLIDDYTELRLVIVLLNWLLVIVHVPTIAYNARVRRLDRA
ncbi:hypothetical protein QL996_07380 [Planococcus sp. APC 4015]|nr:hypothetical protein [Planococcus sp. APC 4015]